jgi:hypothetical protein
MLQRDITPTSGTLGALNATTGTIAVDDIMKVSFQLGGTFSATVTPQFSNDGTNWVAGNMKAANTTSSATRVASTTTANGFEVDCEAWKYFRLVATAYTSGSASVTQMAGFRI